MKIAEIDMTMKTRFFYGQACYNTWPKLFVLSENGQFYSEYLDFMQQKTILEKFDFKTFDPKNYKWDGYQEIFEISESKAKATILTKQANWISKYLNTLK